MNDNLEVLKELFNDQNAFEQGKFGVKAINEDDIENQMVFMSRKEMQQKAKHYEDEDDEDAFREMNDYE